MANTLTKEKTLIEFIPEVIGSEGSPGSPGRPERTVWENRMVRTEVSASAMYSTVTYRDPQTGARQTTGSVFSVPAAALGSITVSWSTPLDALRSMVGSVSAAQAHYSDTWGVVNIPTPSGKAVSYRAPISWTGAWIERMQRVKVVYPAEPPTPPVPPVKGSPARSVYDFHLGWNASAQSSRVLPAGWVGEAEFAVTRPVGAVVGFSAAGSVVQGARFSFASVQYGLVFGDGLIRLRQAGRLFKTLGSMGEADVVRASVFTRSIEWRVNGVLLHRGPFVMSEDFVLDAVLYSGGDAVDSPVLMDGAAQRPERMMLTMAPVAMSGHMGEPLSFALGMKPMEMLASKDKVLQMALKMKPLTAQRDGFAEAKLVLRRLIVSASSEGQNGGARLRAAPLNADGQIEGGDSAWIPKYSIASLGMLPITAAINALSGQVLAFESKLLPPRGRGSELAYGEAVLPMARMSGLADVEAITPMVRAQEMVGAVPTMTQTSYITIVLSERIEAGGAASIAAATVTAQATEQIGAHDEAQITAHIVAAVMEQFGMAEKATALTFRVVDGVPVLVDDGNAWAVNTDAGASTRYENYSFNSFATVGDRHFGVRKDGVYLLEGQKDAGRPIESGVALGKHDFGTQALKQMSSIYAGVSATGQLFLRVGDGRNEYTYQARRVDADMRTQRFDAGRGLRSNYFTFDLVSSGAMELDNITFNVVATTRRI